MALLLILPFAISGAQAQGSADCAKLSDPKAKDDCVRAQTTKTTPAVPATPATPGSGDVKTQPATKATPAVPGGGKGK